MLTIAAILLTAYVIACRISRVREEDAMEAEYQD